MLRRGLRNAKVGIPAFAGYKSKKYQRQATSLPLICLEAVGDPFRPTIPKAK
jgi:hypothetical protein